MNREDFPMLKQNIIYFDNAATTFKPYSVIQAMNEYYTNYTANAHRGDYSLSNKVDQKYEETRTKVKNFINAKKTEEIIFTSGATESLNMIVNGFMKNYLDKDDEILTTKVEHASNILPWFTLENKINYIELENNQVTLENVIKKVNKNTKIITIAHISNVIGDIRPIKEIINYAHKNNIIVVIDAAQSISHIKIDVQELDIDFLVASGHKMCGPTGVGILYAKYKYLDKMIPQILGGGMNVSFDSNKTASYQDLPYKLEAGTRNIAGIIGLGAAIDYIENIGLNNIENHIINLKNYLITKLKEIKKIKIYNENTNTGIIIFNVENVFSQDVSIYLDKSNICIRAGNHCAKMSKEELNITNTCRISLYLYNTIEEIDYLIEKLKENNILEQSL